MSARTKFSIMMFLEFFIWGAWLPPIFHYLGVIGFNYWESVFVLNAFALASITALFFSNQFADRNFAAERFLALSHLIGGAAIIGVGFSYSFWPFFLLLLVHSIFYVPTISITNSIAFANLTNAKDDFGKVRLWGTIGWIAAQYPIVVLLVDWNRVAPMSEVGFLGWIGEIFSKTKSGEAYQFAISMTYVIAGVASLLLAAFCLTLPHTPPRPAREDEDRFAWLKAMKFLSKPFILILFVATFIDATVHQGYFVLTFSYLADAVHIPAQWITPIMSIGQVAEILTMAILGLVLKKWGWRTTMIVGILGHTARFAVFAFFPQPAPAILINVLHGICYAFFFATVYIFVDEYFPKDVRSSAQGLFNFIILGFGPLAGNFLWPALQEMFSTKIGTTTLVNYQKLFLIPSGAALVAAMLLLLFFHPPSHAADQSKPPALPH